MDHKITVEFDATFEDNYAFQWHWYNNSPTARKLRIISLLLLEVLLIPACVLAWFVPVPASNQMPAQVTKFLLTMLPLMMVIPLIHPWAFRQCFRHTLQEYHVRKAKSTLFGKRTITISSEGVVEIGEQSRQSTPWLGIKRIERTTNYVYLYLSTKAAYVVPRRAFPSEEAFDAFVMDCGTFQRGEQPP